MQICVAGCHTNVGKTYTSAMLCASLGYDYFKIIQAGMPKDCEIIASFAPHSKIYPEGYVLQTPASPHIGKKIEKANYNAKEITIPQSKNLVIETAGGLYSPIDEKYCMIDFISHHHLKTLLVGGYYLGSINHILLSIEALKNRNMQLMGLIMSGEQNKDFDNFISEYAKVKILHLPFFDKSNFETIKKDFKQALDIIF